MSSKELLEKIIRYREYLEKALGKTETSQVLNVLEKLERLPVSLDHLQETGIGKTVNGYRKCCDPIGQKAKSIVNKWKGLVQAAIAEEKSQKSDNSPVQADDENEHLLKNHSDLSASEEVIDHGPLELNRVVHVKKEVHQHRETNTDIHSDVKGKRKSNIENDDRPAKMLRKDFLEVDRQGDSAKKELKKKDDKVKKLKASNDLSNNTSRKETSEKYSPHRSQLDAVEQKSAAQKNSDDSSSFKDSRSSSHRDPASKTSSASLLLSGKETSLKSSHLKSSELQKQVKDSPKGASSSEGSSHRINKKLSDNMKQTKMADTADSFGKVLSDRSVEIQSSAKRKSGEKLFKKHFLDSPQSSELTGVDSMNVSEAELDDDDDDKDNGSFLEELSDREIISNQGSSSHGNSLFQSQEENPLLNDMSVTMTSAGQSEVSGSFDNVMETKGMMSKESSEMISSQSRSSSSKSSQKQTSERQSSGKNSREKESSGRHSSKASSEKESSTKQHPAHREHLSKPSSEKESSGRYVSQKESSTKSSAEKKPSGNHSVHKDSSGKSSSERESSGKHSGHRNSSSISLSGKERSSKPSSQGESSSKEFSVKESSKSHSSHLSSRNLEQKDPDSKYASVGHSSSKTTSQRELKGGVEESAGLEAAEKLYSVHESVRKSSKGVSFSDQANKEQRSRDTGDVTKTMPGQNDGDRNKLVKPVDMAASSDDESCGRSFEDMLNYGLVTSKSKLKTKPVQSKSHTDSGKLSKERSGSRTAKDHTCDDSRKARTDENRKGQKVESDAVKKLDKTKSEAFSKDSRKEHHYKSSGSQCQTDGSSRKSTGNTRDKDLKMSEHRSDPKQSDNRTSSQKNYSAGFSSNEESDDGESNGMSFEDFCNFDSLLMQKKHSTKPRKLTVTGNREDQDSATSDIGPDHSLINVPLPKEVELDEDSVYLYPSMRQDFSVKKNATEKEANLERRYGQKTIYSGKKNAAPVAMKSLFEACMQVLQENVDDITYVGGIPADILMPVLEVCNVIQLERLEYFNAQFVGDTEQLWKIHCNRDFRGEEPEELESWRELYMRLRDARKEKLASISKSVKANQMRAEKGVSRTQLTYVDSSLRSGRRSKNHPSMFTVEANKQRSRQEILDSLKCQISKPTDRRRGAGGGGGSGAAYRTEQKSISKPSAPLMQKTLKFFKNMRR